MLSGYMEAMYRGSGFRVFPALVSGPLGGRISGRKSGMYPESPMPSNKKDILNHMRDPNSIQGTFLI